MLVAQSHGPRGAAEVLVHPDLLAGGELVDLRDRPCRRARRPRSRPRSARTRPAAARPRGRRRRSSGGSGYVPRRGSAGSSTTITPPPPAPTRGLTTAMPNAATASLSSSRVAAVQGGDRRYAVELGQVGLVGVPGEDVGAVEQPGRAVHRPRPGQELLGALGVVPGGAHRDQVGRRPVDARVVPGRPGGVDAAPSSASTRAGRRARRRASSRTWPGGRRSCARALAPAYHAKLALTSRYFAW